MTDTTPRTELVAPRRSVPDRHPLPAVTWPAVVLFAATLSGG